MQRPKTVVVAILVAVAASSCASSKNPAPPVPVAGSDAGALAGRWQGEYSSASTGRSGSIVFELKAGDRVAHGDVLMVPQAAGADASKLPGTSDTLSTMPQVLNINFVSSSGGVVTGTMDPYRDPECDCEVQTTFVGSVSGDTVEGTFTTTPSGAAQVTTGRWKMTRQKKK
jgi:hypothetical protein